MTKAEAITILEVSKHMATSGRMYNQAIDMAIEALSEPINCVKCEHYYETEEDGGVAGNCKVDTAHLSERTGEWIFNPKDAIELMFTKPKCSKCGFESADGGNFCSNYGAEMRGGRK